MRSHFLVPMLALAAAACSSGTAGKPQGASGGAGQGGSINPDGPVARGGAAGVPSSGGSNASGGAPSSGGVAVSGGTSAAGGSTAAGGASTSGGVLGNGGSKMDGSAGGSHDAAVMGDSAGGGGKAGSSGSGGGTATSGNSSGGTGAGGSNSVGTIPTGYPAPTTTNYAKCQKVAVSATACAGQDANDICIECLLGGATYNTSETTPTAEATSEAGNYLVTVTLGGSSAGSTFVSAESQRGLLQAVATAAGQSVTYAFVVNARPMEGQPQHAGGPGGYPGLDLFFSGPAASPPQISAIGYALASSTTKPVMVYVASDSTACDQTGGDYGGWGQMLPEFFLPPVDIANYANSGASSSSFYGSSLFWGAIKSHWTAGDWVLIQFGHNDKSVDDATVQANLEKYVADAQAAGVNAVVVSPPARVTSIPISDQSSLHAAAAQAAAAAKNVPYVDLTSLSTAWYNSLGSKTVAMSYHALGTDGTHTNLSGAEKIAGLVAKAIDDQKIGLGKYLRTTNVVASGGGSGGAKGTGGAGGGGGTGGGGTGGSTSTGTMGCTPALGHVTSALYPSGVTLTQACSPYSVGAIMVHDGGVLTIEAGVTLKFGFNSVVAVGASGSGKLVIQGTATAPVTLTSQTASTADEGWYGLQFYSGTVTGSQVAYTTIAYAGGNFDAAIVGESGMPKNSVTLDHVAIDHGNSGSILVTDASSGFVVNSCTVDGSAYTP